jgi:SAM-dependent methyltransferase
MQIFDGLINQTESDPDHVRALYDDWATEYDRNLIDWGYEAPQVSVEFLRTLAGADASVLDLGCGTGMVGRLLAAAGFEAITGVDFSDDSLALAAASDVYSATHQIDLSVLPTTLPKAGFGAVICVGVMSYLLDTTASCREFCRVAAPGAPIVLTQRGDLFDKRDDQAAFDALSAEGLWQKIEVTAERPYLPGNPDFDGVGVRYCVFRRR